MWGGLISREISQLLRIGPPPFYTAYYFEHDIAIHNTYSYIIDIQATYNYKFTLWLLELLSIYHMSAYWNMQKKKLALIFSPDSKYQVILPCGYLQVLNFTDIFVTHTDPNLIRL